MGDDPGADSTPGQQAWPFCGVARWGTTGFEVAFRLRVGPRPVFDAAVTYVSVPPADHTPVVTLTEVAAATGPPVAGPADLDRG